MNVNERYQLKLKVYKKLSFWVGPDPFGLNIFRNAHLDNRFKALWFYEMTLAHKRTYPRRRIIEFENVPDDIRKEVNDRVVDVAMVYYEDRVWTKHRLDRELNELARKIDMTPYEPDIPLYKVYRCDVSTYRSQTNSYGYARANAKQKAELLDKFGFTTEVRDVSWYDEFGEGKLKRYIGGYHSSYEVDYRNVTYAFDVYANCEEYHLDACERMGPTLMEWAVDCWRKGTNPKVYYPFLSDQIYEDSMAIHMGRKEMP